MKSNETEKRLCVTRKEFPQYLGCGLYTADKIAKKIRGKDQGGKSYSDLPSEGRRVSGGTDRVTVQEGSGFGQNPQLFERRKYEQ